MIRGSRFFAQAELLVSVLPSVDREASFALKGGTALNLFIRDIPRLSVDIDLVYTETEPRDEALIAIDEALRRISKSVETTVSGAICRPIDDGLSGRATKLLVQRGKEQIKIEPNLVIRGTVFPSERRTISQKAEDTFRRSASMTIVSVPDLYGGKICAALDRQHPRDLFDIKLLLENEGVTDAIRKAFLVYLVSHDRPMHELLNPTRRSLEESYEQDFRGMTDEPCSIGDLAAARERLCETIRRDLTPEEREFLLSVKRGEPRWELLGLQDVERLPAVKWKLLNIARLKASPAKHAVALTKLKDVLQN